MVESGDRVTRNGKIKNRFRSISEHVLDAKGRLNYPSRFKEVLRQYESGDLMLVYWDKHLRAYPVSEWEVVEDKLMTEGARQPALNSFVRMVMASATECSLDKQGRILISPTLRNDINLEKNVVLTGMRTWVEIWDTGAWAVEKQSAKDNFESSSRSLSELGIF